MKRAICLAVMAVLAIVASASASTATYSGSTSNGQPFDVAFTTSVVGTVTVEAKWQPKGKTRYVLTVKHLVDPSDTFSYDQICQVYEPLDGSGSGQSIGDYTCHFSIGEAGYWTAEFRPLSGKTFVTLVVIAP